MDRLDLGDFYENRERHEPPARGVAYFMVKGR